MSQLKRYRHLFFVMLLVVCASGCAAVLDEGQNVREGEQQAEANQKKQQQDQQRQLSTKPDTPDPQQDQQQGQQQDQQQGQQQNVLKEDVIGQAKISAKYTDGVVDVAAIAIDDKLSVALEVTQRRRFHLRSIRKEVFHRLKEEHPDMTVFVSTDRKVFMELKKIEDVMHEEEAQKLKKKQDKINEDMKG